MKNSFLTNIPLLIALVISCNTIDSDNQLSQTATDVDVAPYIPNDTILVSVPMLTFTPQGILHYNGTPFSGYTISHYKNDKTETITPYFNGLMQGVKKSYFMNGNRRYERPYHKGKKHGLHVGWYETDSLNYEYNFVHGKSEGLHKTWYKSGQLYKEQNYRNGKEYGAQKVYRLDGKYRANYVVRENGRRYGFQGIKRCDIVNTKDEKIK